MAVNSSQTSGQNSLLLADIPFYYMFIEKLRSRLVVDNKTSSNLINRYDISTLKSSATVVSETIHTYIDTILFSLAVKMKAHISVVVNLVPSRFHLFSSAGCYWRY